MPASRPAVVLAGGRARRLGGLDKAAVEVDGRTLLARALTALEGAAEVVVVGEPTATDRAVTFVVEEPRFGGPVAALLAGRDALGPRPPGTLLTVLAVDMPHVDAATVDRLVESAAGHDGAALTDPDGRRQLALVVDLTRLDAVSPPLAERPGHPLHRLLAPLDLVAVGPRGAEHRDIDTPADLADLADPAGPARPTGPAGPEDPAAGRGGSRG